MTERKRVNVNEEYLMQMMAGDVPLYKAQERNEETAEPEQAEPVSDVPVQEAPREPVKSSKKKNTRQMDFEGTFLKEAKIKDRRQMYISGELYDKMSGYLRIIADGKISMVGYIHNILACHMDEFRDTINEMYRNKINRNEPL